MNTTAFGTNPLINPLYEYILWANENLHSISTESVKDLVLNAPWYYREW
jgi:hypothetical protein